MRRPARPLVDLLLLGAGVALPALPSLPGALALIAVAVAWALMVRPPRRETLAVALGFGLAAVALVVATLAARPPDPEVWREQAAVRYAAEWRRVGEVAAEAAERIGAPTLPLDAADRFARHRELDAVLDEAGGEEVTLLLVDPDGQAVAWDGPGLLQEPRPEELPPRGYAFRAGFGSITLLAVVPLGDEPRPWRVVAGNSLPTAPLPFAPPAGDPGAVRWTVVERPTAVRDGAVLLAPDDAPPAALWPPPRIDPSAQVRRAHAVAWFLVGAALLAVAVLRGVGVALLAQTRLFASHRPWVVATLGAAGWVSVGLGLAVQPEALAAFAGGAASAAAGLLATRRARSGTLAALAGGVLAAGLALAALGFQTVDGTRDLGSSLLGSSHEVALRLAVFLAALGGLAWAGGRGAGVRRDGWALAALVLLLAAAAAHDHPWLAGPLLLAGGAAGALWAGRSEWRRRGGGAAVLALLAALLAAGAWQTAQRQALRAENAELLPALAPPRQQEIQAVWEELSDHLVEVELGDLAPRDVTGMAWRDLAYVLWRGSPLARGDALSALAVIPPDGRPLPFSFGLPLTEEGELDLEPVRWEGLALPAWREALIEGDGGLRAGGRPWGTVRWWLLPLPGFRRGAVPVEGLAARLLRGGPVRGLVEGLPAGARYALYDAAGKPLVDPWNGGAAVPPLDGRRRAVTPEGPAWAWFRHGADGTEALYLPILGPAAALERVGIHALGSLLVAGALALGAALVALFRPSVRDLVRRGLHSYSKRLLLVYGSLLVLPLLLLNAVLFRTLEDRLRFAQRAGGEAALQSAQQVLGEYVLSLEPGYGLETALDDELLVWLSRVIRHEVNLYWGSAISASSKRELFTAGLLPERIPGGAWARLALRGGSLAARTNRAAGVSYLELYAPLAIPGVPREDAGLFLSVPLLAQQEEVAREVNLLRRRTFLLTAALAALAAALGTLLSRGFTRPLQELVAGTRRIASGATSLDLAPTEVELAALVEAIDDMARRLAEGRERLLREKQLVERVVEHVNAGIVSVDRGGRVMMRNRVAAEQLAVAPGQVLADGLAADEALLPVAAFARGGEAAREATVRLVRDDEERDYHLVWVPIPGGGAPAALLVVEDATEVLRSQRLEAWAEMARIIAHEIKNPLTPIRLSTEHMVEVHRHYPDQFDEIFEGCAGNILQQVDELQLIAQEFSTYAHIPRLDPRPGDLAAAMERVAGMYGARSDGTPTVRFATASRPLAARFDPRLLQRAVRNLLENALRVSAGAPIELALAAEDGMATVTVADHGPGVAPELLGRIFEPYFSTHDAGTGLGLPIARRIAEEHGGGIAARNRPQGGLAVTITIPLR